MTDIPKEELVQRYQKLPQILKDAIFAEATADKVFDIGKRHSLTVDKVGAMASQIGYIMLGVESADNFISNLVSNLGIPRETAQKIAGDVNAEILYPIREHIRGTVHLPTSSSIPPQEPSMIFPGKMQEAHHEEVGETVIPRTFSHISDIRKDLESSPSFKNLASEEKLTEVPPSYKKTDPYRETVERSTPQQSSWKLTKTSPESIPPPIQKEYTEPPSLQKSMQSLSASLKTPSKEPETTLPQQKQPTTTPPPQPVSGKEIPATQAPSSKSVPSFRGISLKDLSSGGPSSPSQNSANPPVPPPGPQSFPEPPKQPTFAELRKALGGVSTSAVPTPPTPSAPPSPANTPEKVGATIPSMPPTPQKITPPPAPPKASDPYREVL